ncbi:MAG: hypothetical protein RIQ53_2337 [Pseudomonadota bacterium]|jgi:hypothetical protein
MDDIVKAAMAKWPDVPHCHGWLALDGRGDWYMRDERVQAAGAFPQVKGSRVTHEKLLGFIGRNYLADAQGAWYFQNGPQRVYVTLEATPWIWRVRWDVAACRAELHGHTGVAPAAVHGAGLDEDGLLYLATDRGLGRVHPQDLLDASQALEAGQWPLDAQPWPAQDLPARFGFVREPRRG